MDDKRVQAYWNLIQMLLQCADGEEPEILEANRHLLDVGLIEMMERVATEFTRQGDSRGVWLQDVAQKLAGYLNEQNNPYPSHDYLDFIQAIFQNIDEDADKEQIYRLFRQNLDKLNIKFVEALQIWAEQVLSSLRTEEDKFFTGKYFCNFGMLIQNFPLGNQPDNINIAIAGYQIALAVYTKSDFPEEWVAVQINLGSAYLHRTEGSRTDSIETAIQFFDNALTVCTQYNSPKEWAGTHNNLCAAYIYLSRIKSSSVEYVEKAIWHLEQTLKVRKQSNFPLDWARTQRNLGSVYYERIQGNKAENIEKAIQFCNNALSIYSQRELSFDWAETQSNLGLVYNYRIRGSKAENIEQAIQHHRNALGFFTQQNFPREWAETQNNLGLAYLDRIQGDRIDDIEKAIQSFQYALTIYTKQNYPQQWARIQRNLISAYLKRIRGYPADNFEKAIKYGLNALEVYTQQDYPLDWAATQTNLGGAYGDRIRGDRAENIEKAIDAYQNALQVRTRQEFPYRWAIIQSCLGNAYGDRIRGDRAENLERAIDYYQNALQIHTKQNSPFDWARIQNNLGATYRQRIKGSRDNNYQKAIECYEAALTIHKLNGNLSECRRVSRNLGDLHFHQGNWECAVEAYATTIEVIEQRREWSNSDENRQDIISESLPIYQNIIQAYINLGQTDRAIEYVERNKTRNLVDLLATRDLHPKGDFPQEVINRLNSLRRAAIAEERRLIQQGGITRDIRSIAFDIIIENNQSLEGVVDSDEYLNRDRLNQIRQELDNLVKTHIQPIDPSFQLTQKVEPISFLEIQQTLPNEKTALIEWYISVRDRTLLAFIVTSRKTTPIYIHYTAEHFQTINDIPIIDYNRPQGQSSGQWQTLSNLLPDLAHGLRLEFIIEQIKQIISECDQLILVPHLWLHLLPIHALPLSDGKCLLDLFPKGVSYAPSAQLLQLTQRQNKPLITNLLAVQNPTEDLEFADLEVTAIRSQFASNDDVLVKEEASRKVLTTERLSRANLAHFSCHGYFNRKNPELSGLLMSGSKVSVDFELIEEELKPWFLPSEKGESIDLRKCLTLSEIFNLDLINCSLVTLSACETGITDFMSFSDEYIGLPSGFLFAGCTNVVSSLWTVNDFSTAFLMIKFYQNLGRGNSAAVALNQAQLWLRNITKKELLAWIDEKKLIRDRTIKMKLIRQFNKMSDSSQPFKEPYFWAAFFAVGQ